MSMYQHSLVPITAKSLPLEGDDYKLLLTIAVIEKTNRSRGRL